MITSTHYGVSCAIKAIGLLGGVFLGWLCYRTFWPDREFGMWLLPLVLLLATLGFFLPAELFRRFVRAHCPKCGGLAKFAIDHEHPRESTGPPPTYYKSTVYPAGYNCSSCGHWDFRGFE